jgi:predicted nucleic-acid-binding protein
MIMWKNLLRKILSDEESSTELYEKVRKDFTDIIQKYSSSRNSEKAKLYDDLALLLNLVEALNINANEDRKRMDSVIESLLKTQEERDKTIKQLQQGLQDRNKELTEFKEKHGTQLGWIDKFFQRASETSPE